MEEDERREAAIASAASSLHSNGCVTPSRLSKFQELHRRRLKIKAKSKIKKKTKGLHDGSDKSEETGLVTEKYKNEESSLPNEDSSVTVVEVSSLQQGETKKRQKLHWGLDTKERWEMKANM